MTRKTHDDKDSSKDFMTITNKDIWQKLLSLEGVITATHDQALKTNGRVTAIEARSIGIWISNHPIRFAALCVFAISLIQPEARDAVFQFAKNLI